MRTERVDPFLGWGEMRLPRPSHPADTWFFLKAQCGNTHPGACLPFQPVSVLPYSGAYPSGYGTHAPNSCGRVPRAYEGPCASGFTHFHHSGTGFIGVFYNYLRVVPVTGDWRELDRLRPLGEERARPGWYAARLGEVSAQVTVAPMAALHTYRFPSGGPHYLAVDLVANGLAFPRTQGRTGPTRIVGQGRDWLSVALVREGVTLYAHLQCRNAATLRLEQRAGAPIALFPVGEGEAELRIGFSCAGAADAAQRVVALAERPFAGIARDAQARWEEALSAMEAEFGDPARDARFDAFLYHAFKKPYVLSPGPFGPGPFTGDLATLWDMYKTQLPLVATLFPETMAQIVNGYLNTAERLGFFPNAVLLSDDFGICAGQARGLFQHTIADAYYRGVPGVDYRRALALMRQDILANRDFCAAGRTAYPVHTLDLSCACAAAASLARALGGEEALADFFAAHAGCWRNAYEPDGLLPRDCEYYEGSYRNYSFRLLPNMAARIALSGGPAAFVAQLDDFFGFGAPPVPQAGPLEAPEGLEQMRAGAALARFEGVNNEPDMDAPYAYLWAGRHDRTCEVIASARESVFGWGPGALPGNDDSGALTSWFLWDAVGLFPVPGRNLMLIGAPACRRARLRDFQIVREGEGPYLGAATLNGASLAGPWFPASALARGGELRLTMSAAPTGFGALPPPSEPY